MGKDEKGEDSTGEKEPRSSGEEHRGRLAGGLVVSTKKYLESQ